jgi:short-subunit dehydrogenase
LFARRIDILREVEAEIVSAGGRAMCFRRRRSATDTLREAAWKLERAFGPIDVMIANAGIGASTRGQNLPLDDVSRIINVNLIGAANSAAAVIPQMVRRGSGRVVAIASLAAIAVCRIPPRIAPAKPAFPNSTKVCASICAAAA